MRDWGRIQHAGTFCFYGFPEPQCKVVLYAIEIHMPLKTRLTKKIAKSRVTEFPDTSSAAAVNPCWEDRKHQDEA